MAGMRILDPEEFTSFKVLVKNTSGKCVELSCLKEESIGFIMKNIFKLAPTRNLLTLKVCQLRYFARIVAMQYLQCNSLNAQICC